MKTVVITQYSQMRVPLLVRAIRDVISRIVPAYVHIPADRSLDVSTLARLRAAYVVRAIRKSDEAWRLRRMVKARVASLTIHFN